MKIHVDSTALRAVGLLAAGNDEMRYYLRGVHVEAGPQETVLVATDGAAMGVHRSEAANELEHVVSFTVPNDVIKQIKKGAAKHLEFISEDAGKTWKMRGAIAGSAVEFAPIDSAFPEWRRVVPKGKASGKVAQFDPELLLKFKKAAAVFGSKAPCILVAHNGASDDVMSAAIVDIRVPGFVGVAMPMRQWIREGDKKIELLPMDTVPPEFWAPLKAESAAGFAPAYDLV